MDKAFWHQRWQARELGFHQDRPNRLLTDCFGQLGLSPGQRVFVPLCGKTLDIAWLLAKGCHVIGVELSQIAVEELFAELGADPDISMQGAFKKFCAPNLEILVGDFFDLRTGLLGPVDAVYDRAALVALPDAMRQHYASYLSRITGTADQLLICFEYDQGLMDGPPFSVPGPVVSALYGQDYRLTQLAIVDVPGGLKGQCPARECVWLLKGGSRDAPV